MKKPWQSKTIWLNIILALTALIPSVHDFIVARPELLALFFAGVNMILRLVSKDKIQLLDDAA